MAKETIHEGGCLCGAVRYRAEGEPDSVGHCHCTMCRKAASAPVVTWITFPREKFTFTGVEPATYRSSDHGRRRFCPNCGSQITFWTSHEPELIDVTVGSLDDPDTYPPDHHSWTSVRIGWLHLDAQLPDYPEFKDD